MTNTNEQTTMAKTTFIELLSRSTFIVPEIQREYVWGSNKELIENFIKSISSIETAKEGEELNLGFLYSYTPSYATSEQKISYLIDGQQRFTTLYLLVFYTFLEMGELSQFRKIAKNFSYRVRHSTAQFLEKLVTYTQNKADLKDIEDKHWFLSYYKQDISISNILEFIKIINMLDNDKLPNYDQIKSVNFYNFNIAATGQGEELYISINSRGEKIQDNENLRAKLFEKISDADKRADWAIKYDNWQEFFWKNKGNNPTADIGFNTFNGWVELFEQKGAENTKDDLEFKDYEKYFIGLKKLVTRFEKIAGSVHKEAKIALDGKAKEAFVLPLLYMLSDSVYSQESRLTDENFERFARFFANIVYNKDSQQIIEGIKLAKYSVKKSIFDPIDLLNQDIENNLLDAEEKKKLEIYSKAINREEIEDLALELENTKMLKGCIEPFIQKAIHDEQFSFEQFKQYKEIFMELFANADDVKDLVRRALLTFYPESDYVYWVGWTWAFGGAHKYTLCSNSVQWHTSWSNSARRETFFKLFDEIITLRKNKESDEVILKLLIGKFLSQNDSSSYYYHIIKSEEILGKSESKYIVSQEKDGEHFLRHVLRKTTANTRIDVELQT